VEVAYWWRPGGGLVEVKGWWGAGGGGDLVEVEGTLGQSDEQSISGILKRCRVVFCLFVHNKASLNVNVDTTVSNVWGHLEMSLFFKVKHCFYQ